MMIVTEEEAKTKRCCGPSGTGTWLSDDAEAVGARMCIGSACMAWRWRSQHVYKPLPDEAYNLEVAKTVTDKSIGFCGYAGA